MIETIEQAREAVARLMSVPVNFAILMDGPAANYAQYLWQAAYREAHQGEGQDYPACVPGSRWEARHHESYWESGCCDVCGAWAEDAPASEHAATIPGEPNNFGPDEYDPEDDIDGDYLDSLERDSIDGPEYWQESGAYALGY